MSAPRPPSNETLEALLAAQFQQLPEPDLARLAAIGKRVSSTAARPVRSWALAWWLVGLTFMGLATASYVMREQPSPAASRAPATSGSLDQRGSPAASAGSPKPTAPERSSGRNDPRFGY